MAADFPDAEPVSPQYTSDRLWRPIELLGHLFDRSLHELLTQDLQLRRNFSLDSVQRRRPTLRGNIVHEQTGQELLINGYDVIVIGRKYLRA
jgi:hypothetical protein